MKSKYHAYKAIFDQEGGKLLVASLRSDVENCAQRIASLWSTLTLDEFKALGAEMSAKQKLISDLTNAEKNMKTIE
jgi:hypothetical protein